MGFKDVKKYTRLNIFSSLSALFLTCLLLYIFELEGALYAIVANQMFVTIIMVTALRSQFWISAIINFIKRDKDVIKKLLSFSAMAMIGVVSLPVTLLIIRTFLIEKEGLEFAGCWEAIWKISQYYLMVLTTGFGVYLLPTYSSIQNKVLLRKEVFKSLRFVFVVASTLALLIFVLRKYLILLLFDEAFLDVVDFMNYQLVGDVIKVCSWSIGLLLQAKSKTILFIITQIIFNSLFIGLTLMLYQ